MLEKLGPNASPYIKKDRTRGTGKYFEVHKTALGRL